MNPTTQRHQAAVHDPDWYTRTSTRLKPGGIASAESTVIDDLVSLGGSLTSLNLESNLFDFESLGHYSTRSMPAIMATDAPWNESPRSLRSHTVPSARRIAASSIPPPGVSPLDHLQNSISSINTRGGPPLGHIITEEDDQDITELNESLASLDVEALGLRTQSAPDMDATAHAGNMSRGRLGVGRPAHGRFNRPSRSHPTINNQQFYPTIPDDEDDNDDVEIIKLLRHQVQTLKKQLAEEQSKNLQLVAGCNNSVRSLQSHSASSGTGFGKDDDDDSDFAYPTANSSVDTTPTSNAFPNEQYLALSEAMQAIQTTVRALEKPLIDEKDTTLLLEDMQTHLLKLEREQEKLVKDHTKLLSENTKQSKTVQDQGMRILELEAKLRVEAMLQGKSDLQ